jgi:hypothetical protein
MPFLYLTGHLSRHIFVYEEHRFPRLLVCAAPFLGVLYWRFPAVDVSLVYRSVRLVRKLAQAKETTALSYLVSCLMYSIKHSVLLSGCWLT